MDTLGNVSAKKKKKKKKKKWRLLLRAEKGPYGQPSPTPPLHVQIQRSNTVTNLIYLGIAYLIKALRRHKAPLNIPIGGAHKSNFDIFKPW